MDKKKILITGGYGQLGTALKETLSDEEILLTDTDTMDITDPVQIGKTFLDFKPTHLIHGAAYTNVDGCEENPDLARSVNTEGTENLAKACKKHQCQMTYVSTDYVFDGSKGTPYTEEDKTNPQSVYGKTKLGGEKVTEALKDFYIVRTQWVYGEGKNFVRTMLSLSEKIAEVRVVNDQFGRPTYAPDLAEAIYHLIKTESRPGIYNFSNDGDIITWADFAKEIFKITNKKTKVVGISTEEYLAQYPDKKIAKRPKYSAVELNKIKDIKLSSELWNDSLRKYLVKEATVR